MVTAQREGTGAAGALKALAEADFDIAESPYPDLIRRYFER
jgi:hypothetical protein